MQTIKSYWSIAKTAAREDRTNPRRLISGILQMLCRTMLVVAIYRVAYKYGGSQRISYANAMWTVGLCFTFFINLGVRMIYHPVELEIRSGDVETGIIKPRDWRLVKVVQLLGKSLREFVIQIFCMSSAMWLAVGPPSLNHMTPGVALIFLLFFVMSVITAAAMFMMVGLSAFWLNDAKSVFRIVDKTALICCGTFVPLALLPDVMQQVIRFTPFNIYAAPTRFFDPTVIPHLNVMLISGAIWMIGMVGLCQLMWYRASRKIEVNGG